MNDIKFMLMERQEQWRKAQQTTVELGNQIAVNDKNSLDIRVRMYEWSDEALARTKECGAILDLIDQQERDQ
jgi:hypothetical protein